MYDWWSAHLLEWKRSRRHPSSSLTVKNSRVKNRILHENAVVFKIWIFFGHFHPAGIFLGAYGKVTGCAESMTATKDSYSLPFLAAQGISRNRWIDLQELRVTFTRQPANRSGVSQADEKLNREVVIIATCARRGSSFSTPPVRVVAADQTDEWPRTANTLTARGAG
ncbi:uncharacterized protein CIMG_13760 [Coccidioides immitis RS]|uniref:Uncharacterized protein n=1 Tax=Coccidioides immitis (strain RS) TaxID=246410 RepID=A0A0D8JWT3_COCIM|nr:uncharacterized protein CIMG_13760 [Coccidioides immitis RS]KJF61594.1 hypothetical protein CIMG_13760 [Coccidioides immitis RS]